MSGFQDILVPGDLRDAVSDRAWLAALIESERPLAGLVGSSLLGRDDPFERDPEPPRRKREQVVVAVGDHAQPEPGGEPSKRLRRVWERWPLADRATKTGALVVVCCDCGQSRESRVLMMSAMADALV